MRVDLECQRDVRQVPVGLWHHGMRIEEDARARPGGDQPAAHVFATVIFGHPPFDIGRAIGPALVAPRPSALTP